MREIIDSQLAAGTMGTWKRKRFEKKRKGSHTPGKVKKGTCVASTQSRYMARRSRSYKDPNYPDWVLWANKVNKI